MKIFTKRRMAPLAALTLIASLGTLLLAPPAYARSDYLSDFNTLYSSSASDNNASCQLCHGSSNEDLLNPYGRDLCVLGGSITARMQAVETQDSDADPTGADNITEINASTQPGWTPGNVNPTYVRGNCNRWADTVFVLSQHGLCYSACRG